MYSDEEDFDIRVYGGNNNDALMEDWMKSNNNSRRFVAEGYKPAVVESDGKPWNMPGSNLADYFNFGFTEESWNDFLVYQINLRRQRIADREAEDQKKRSRQGSPDDYYRKKSKHDDHRKTRR